MAHPPTPGARQADVHTMQPGAVVPTGGVAVITEQEMENQVGHEQGG